MSYTNYREQAQRFLQHAAATGQPLNDAAARYGTEVIPAQAAPGTGYWRALGVYHLKPEENRGLHNAYVEVIDEQGRRVQNPGLRVAWTWEGRDEATQEARPAALEKPESEPVANVPIEKGMRLRLWIEGDGPSDSVAGLSAHHPDEPGPGGELWNSEGHHSFFVLFQRARMAEAPVVTGPVTGPVTEPVTKPVTGPQPEPAGAFRFEAWPTTDRRITQRFGERPEVYAGHGLAGHEGIDIAAEAGAPVFSVAPGVVHFVQPVDDGKPYGIQVRIDHAGGYQTIYAHLSQALVAKDERVAAGQTIGLAGETGNSEGPHLHLTLKQIGVQTSGYTPGIIDPLPFLQPLVGAAPSGPVTGPTLPPAVRRLRLRDKLGLDANRPFDPANGRLAPQVRDPDVIAAASPGWVRLNFILGERWSSPTDQARSDEGRTWEETYRAIVQGFRDRGLQVYGLISDEAVRRGIGDDLRGDPGGARSHPWIAEYVAAFTTIVRMFRRDVRVFESFNEPDDWHGQQRNWVHPGWFAILLEQVYRAVKEDPDLRDVTLVSGPLQGLVQGNGAADYLRRTYEFGTQQLGWGSSRPFPFDGIGYHLYVNQGFHGDFGRQRTEVANTLARYLGEMQDVVRRFEGRTRPFYISEVGWTSNDGGDAAFAFQAESMKAGLEWLARRDDVALAVYFCTQDFTDGRGRQWYGLYREGGVDPGNRKRSFDAFRALAALEVEVGTPATKPVSPVTPVTPPVAERPLRGVGRVTASDGLNLREGPGTQFATRVTLAADSLVDVLAAAGDWLRVRFGAQEGYLHSGYVAVSPLPAALPTPRPPVAALPAPVPPVTPAGKPLAQADPELYKIWREHIAQGFANNNTMFRRVLNGFMLPYWITVALYVLLVLVGVGLFILGVWLATAGNQAVAGVISCGLGVAALLSFFVARPLQALEENLQFITWLGVIYNSYWTRLAMANDPATVDEDVNAATESTIGQIKDLQTQHAALSGRRPNIS